MQLPDSNLNRRNFLKRASVTAGGIVTATTLGMLNARAARWKEECRIDPRKRPHHGRLGKGYGPLYRVPDQNGREILAATPAS